MKNKEIVLFDNTDYSERYAETQKELYERFAEDYDWDFIEDVPMDMIHDEMNFHEEIDYHYFKDKMKQLLQKNDCLLVGVCGRWNGPAEGGQFISNFYDLMSVIGHLDYYKITDRNGHLSAAMKTVYLQYDTYKRNNNYCDGSIGALNGYNKIEAPLPDSIDEIVKIIKEQGKRA